MGRRSFGLSATAINRMLSASRARQKANERDELIEKESQISSTEKISVSLEKTDFDSENRFCRLLFLQTTNYRPIERYVTQNGTRYPIHGEWKTRSKQIRKTIKLTNDNLEKLNTWDDELICKFRHEIVFSIGDPELYPSWFKKDVALNDYDEKISLVREDSQRKQEDLRRNILSCLEKIQAEQETLKRLEAEIQKKQKKLSSYARRISKLTKKEGRILKIIVSFGLFCLFSCRKRLNFLEGKKQRLEDAIASDKQKSEFIKQDIEKKNKTVAALNKKIGSLQRQQKKQELLFSNDLKEELALIQPLRTSVDQDETGFVPLKVLCGLPKEKITGCYVIRNRENGKHYVGQSKDVLKRITREHFSGTKVRNIIFAEDYFASNLENKDELFEVKIIRCSTKDELDETERNLIERLNSFNEGYNGTNGNS